MKLFKIAIFSILLTISIYAKDKPLKILVFQSYHQTLPWAQQVLSGLDKFKKNYNGNIEFYLETIDYIRLKKQMKPDDWVKYLNHKYQGLEFDGILIETIFASELYKDISSSFHPNIPKIYFADINIKEKNNSKVIFEQKSEIVTKTINLAIRHNPNLKNVYVIKSDKAAKVLENELLKELKKRTLNTIYIKDFTIESLKVKLSKLPKDSVVFYGVTFYDKTKRTFTAKDFLRQISQSSSVPIYSFYNTFLGTGTIGGYMTDGETAIQEILKSLLNYIHHDKFINKIETFNLFIDFNILKKYGINEKRNPKNAIIVNKPIPIWENYPKETLFALSTIILLSILLILTFILKIRNERISKMEDSMFIQSKQAAMGEMISVIAHQWRQPLNNISIMVQTILLKYQRKTIDETIMKTFKTDIFKQIKYMSNTVDDFKDFYKPNKQKIKFDIKQELIRTIELIENTYIQDGIKIEKNLLNNFNIEAYPNEISHCFLILLQNAKDALKESDNAKKVIQISIQTNKNECIISFKNNGKKIPINIKDKIFKPYFSTKKEKNGTGIGLYMAKTIIEKHFNGSIKVTNTLNGVNFEIRIVNVR